MEGHTMTSTEQADLAHPELVVSASRAKRPIVAYVSTRALADPKAQAKLHLDISCPGLDRAVIHPHEDLTLAVAEFANLRSLASWSDARPCRVCALEPVLDTVLRAGRAKNLVFATFTSQPNPGENLRRYKWRSATESGSARLSRIAERLNLPVAHTSCGQVTWGVFPAAGVRALQRNLRTYTRNLPDLPDAQTVQMLWALLDESPPELGGPDGPSDPWDIAELVSAH
jgi:hypothetical protein